MSVANQRWLEEHHSSIHAAKLVIQGIKDSPLQQKLFEAQTMINTWIASPSAHPSIDVLKASIEDVERAVHVVVKNIAIEGETSLAALVMQCLSVSKLERRQAIQATAEVIALVSKTGLFSIEKGEEIWMVYSNIQLPLEVIEHLDQTSYLPPLITKPKVIRKNMDSGYLTYESESQILGHKTNRHEEWISLDVINTQNQIPLQLCEDFVAVYQEETPDFLLDDYGNPRRKWEVVKAEVNWHRYKRQVSYFQSLLSGFGNKFYMVTKVDKRGRLYCSGYHLSYQGTSYRKASIELFKEEFIPLD
jgi:hypothetical protein